MKKMKKMLNNSVIATSIDFSSTLLLQFPINLLDLNNVLYSYF